MTDKTHPTAGEREALREFGYELTEDQITQVCYALVRSRDGYVSESATGLPVLPAWRSETLSRLDAAIDTMARMKKGRASPEVPASTEVRQSPASPQAEAAEAPALTFDLLVKYGRRDTLKFKVPREPFMTEMVECAILTREDARQLAEALAAAPTSPSVPAAQEVALPMGAVLAAYRVGSGPNAIRVERAGQMQGPDKWAVRRVGDCLNKAGAWEWEPMPSGRDDEFLERCRFDSAEEAFAALAASVQEDGEKR